MASSPNRSAARLFDDFLAECRAILWEAKSAQRWADRWVEKLKADQRRIGADLAVIVTATLPRGIAHIDYLRGVWVADFSTAPQLALVLRESLIGLAHVRAALAAKNDLMGTVYDYVCGPAFVAHVKAMLDALGRMESQLSDERHVFERIWAKRQKDIQTCFCHLARMVGDLQGLGASLALPGHLALEPGRRSSG